MSFVIMAMWIAPICSLCSSLFINGLRNMFISTDNFYVIFCENNEVISHNVTKERAKGWGSQRSCRGTHVEWTGAIYYCFYYDMTLIYPLKDTLLLSSKGWCDCVKVMASQSTFIGAQYSHKPLPQNNRKHIIIALGRSAKGNGHVMYGHMRCTFDHQNRGHKC